MLIRVGVSKTLTGIVRVCVCVCPGVCEVILCQDIVSVYEAEVMKHLCVFSEGRSSMLKGHAVCACVCGREPHRALTLCPTFTPFISFIYLYSHFCFSFCINDSYLQFRHHNTLLHSHTHTHTKYHVSVSWCFLDIFFFTIIIIIINVGHASCELNEKIKGNCDFLCRNC